MKKMLKNFWESFVLVSVMWTITTLVSQIWDMIDDKIRDSKEKRSK